jgi:tetratricopeptide (TPR) repeat protein
LTLWWFYARFRRMKTSYRDPTAFLLLFCLIFIIYGNTFHATWHLDDPPAIIKNLRLHIEDLYPRSLVKTFFANPDQSPDQKRIYRPLSCLTFAINWYFGKENVIGYHMVNITIHLLTAFFLYLAVFNILKTPIVGDKYRGSEYFIALLSAVLWAVNPIQTQAVTYIVQRMASMAAMFYILSLLFYLKGRNSNSLMSRVFFFLGCFLSYLLGMASKENAMILPMALLLLETTFFQDLGWAKTRRTLLWVVVGLGLLIIVFGSVFFLRSNPISLILNGYENRFFSPLQRMMTETRILLFYLSQIFYPVPTRLSIEHDLLISTSLLNPWTTLPSIGLVLGLIIFGLCRMRKLPILSFAVLFYFLNHSIESTFLNLELIFEHRNYLPSLFLFFPVSIGIKRLLDYYHNKKNYMYYILISFSIFLIVGFGISTYIRNMAWASEKTLWEDAVTKSPEMMRSLHNLAWGYYERNGRYDEALELYRKAFKLKAHSTDHRLLLLSNMANINLNIGRYRKAANVWKEAIDAYPGHAAQAELHYGLALSQSKMGELEKAFANIETAISKRPNGYKYINLKGYLLLKEKKYEEAITFFRRSLKLRPNYEKGNENMGICLSLMQNYDRAEWFFRRVHVKYPKDLVILLWLIEVNMRAGDKGDVDLYVGKLFAAANVYLIASTLRDVSEENLMSQASQKLLIQEIAGRIKGKVKEIAAFSKNPMD